MRKLSMLKILMLLAFCSISFAQDYVVVDEPDIAEPGWYYVPSEGGWGLNLSIQPAIFSSTGYYMFGSIFTYDENGVPIWYTYQGEYTPNDDVFAWREGRGAMGSITSPLYIATGGNCPTCTYSPNELDVSDLGQITITWSDPLNATMQIGDTVKQVQYQSFHAGLNNNDADFITDGAWQVFGMTASQKAIKGLVKFVPYTKDEFLSIDGADTYQFSDDYVFYINDNLSDLHGFNSSDGVNSDDANIFYDDFYKFLFVLAYDKSNNKATYFSYREFYDFINDITDRQITCSIYDGFSLTATLRPAVGAMTRFYFDDNGQFNDCDLSYLTIQDKRQMFISMIKVSQGGSDIARLPVFNTRPDVPDQ